MFQDRLKSSVTPSGVPFTVRNFKGGDQDLLTDDDKGTPTERFNKMLKAILIKLGDKDSTQIMERDVEKMFTNDRKFILVVARMHTLEYQNTFDFKFEFGLQSGGSSKQREIFDYSIELTHANFPVTPFQWVQEACAAQSEKQKSEGGEPYNPDGYIVEFPVVFENYSEMVTKHAEHEGEFKNGVKYKWRLLTGETETTYSKASSGKKRINIQLDMRAPRYLYNENTWTMLESHRADILYLEHLRMEIPKIEGTIDTNLVIQHKTDPSRVQRVDLTHLSVFFFPSEANS